MEKPPEEFDALTEALQRLQRELDATYSALSRGPDAEAELRAAELREKRAALFERWGLTALAWIARGGAVRLTEGDSPALVVVPVPDIAELEEAQTEEIGEHQDLSWLEDEEDGEEIPMTEEVPAGDLDLARLREAVLSPRWSHKKPPRAPAFDPAELAALRKRLGPPPLIKDSKAGNAELTRLSADLEHLDGWRRYPRSVQRALMGLFAARLRHLQDECPVRNKLDKRKLSTAFPHLTRFSDDARPGFVKGLSRGQSPDHGSWQADAVVWWDALAAELEVPDISALRRPGTPNADRALDGLRKLLESESVTAQSIRSAAILALDAGLPVDNAGLIRALKPHLSNLEGDARLKSLRRAIRQAVAADNEAEADLASECVIPADWPFLELTRGKTAVIVGGDQREQSRAAIQEALGFTTLTWESGYDVRAVQALAGRIERDGVDFVIFLRRFISHKMTDILLPACKASDSSWIMVDQGYGLTRVKLGIERYLTAPDS